MHQAITFPFIPTFIDIIDFLEEVFFVFQGQNNKPGR